MGTYSAGVDQPTNFVLQTGHESCRYAPAPNRVFVDADGDLTLQVGPTSCLIDNGTHQTDGSPKHEQRCSDHDHEVPTMFVVCSKAMSRASPFFKRLLYGDFAESKKLSGSGDADWVVSLPDDNVKAMTMILNILHCRFEFLPRASDSIELDDLYQLTVLTDKYDLTTILRPWATTWMKDIGRQYGNITPRIPPMFFACERHIWIAWELGDMKTLSYIASYLTLHSVIDSTGALTVYDGFRPTKLFHQNLEVPELCDIIAATRMEAIEAAFWPFRYSIQRLLQKPTSPYIPKLCQCVTPDITSQSTALAAPSEDCDTLMLGRVIQSLSGENLWPLPGITLQWSIGLLHSTLKRLNVRGSHLINHENCVAVKGLDEKFQGRVEDTWVNLTDAQKKHLESQARKSGFTE